ncbi:energy transducer TonB [Seonamhaeicola maritimus]|uniref:TonB C-terminal domain-containing protein n=1 Tax=Seonamhaeicola maritimus TaxID=2591822 RepID=A0A5C7GH30_9FLAO|nr:hypothetical protein [Seonamhaeicola maritimus]TXG37060.1 hypothetical protein FUA22_10880 [Seonamhaeicola maritimus]
MEKHIQTIELINDYLNERLSEVEIQIFKNRLKADASFNKEFEDHVLFLEGMKRQQLKADVKKGKQVYIKYKWFKYFGFTSVIVVLVAIVFMHKNSKDAKIEKTNPVEIEVKDSEPFLDLTTPKDSSNEILLIDTSKVEKVLQKEEVVEKENIKPQTEITEVKIPEKIPETITINVAIDSTIICNEGTKLIIKANSFVDDNNQIVTGNIDLKVMEYYKLSDMLLANLSTQSDGQFLETGGMLFIEAKQNDKKLLLNENTLIEIIFPTKKKNMQMFSGNWDGGNINWNLQKETALVDEIELVEIVEEEIDVPFAVIEEVPVYPGCENLSRNNTRNCTSERISQFVMRNFNTQMVNDIGLRGKQRINVIFKIDKNGHVVDIRSRSSELESEIEANRVIALLPKMKPGKQRGRAVNVPFSLPIIFQADGSASVGRSLIDRRNRDSIFINRVESKLSSNDNKNVSVAEVNSYVLRTSKLGWINCDRFINTKDKLRYTVRIEDAQGDIRVNMVFKSWNSVLPSRRSGKVFDFKMVPENEEVILIAIKKDKGKIFLDVVETTTEENPQVEFNFKEVDLEGLKVELKKLNKLF